MDNKPLSASPDHYTRLASLYDLLHYLQTFGQDHLWRREAALAVPKNARLVLDLCTGTGLTAAAICKHRPNCAVVGVDWNPMMLRKAERRLAKRCAVRFVQGDAQCLPFSDTTFDAVTSICALGGIPDLEAAAREIARVLVPGGTVFAVEMCTPPRPGLRRFLHKSLMELWITKFWAFRDVPLEAVLRSASMRIISSDFRMEFGLGSVCRVVARASGG